MIPAKEVLDILFDYIKSYFLESIIVGYNINYHHKNWKDVRPIPENPIIDEDEYIARQGKIVIKYERDLEARIKYDKIF